MLMGRAGREISATGLPLAVKKSQGTLSRVPDLKAQIQ
jgi:hypothetical protein